MNSNEITDLLVGFALLFLMIIAVAVGFYSLDGDSDNKAKFSDEERLFLLNYLKTDVGDRKIADMIALNENGDSDSLENLQGISRNILNFYGFNGRNYVLRIKYPNGNVMFLTASREGDLPSPEPGVDTRFGELERYRTELGSGEKIRIPSINNGLIVVELEVEDE